MKPKTLLIALLATGFAANAEAAPYLGNGRTSFGGPVGGGSLESTDDGTFQTYATIPEPAAALLGSLGLLALLRRRK